MSEQERPWTEEQWEQFFKESDLRAARFGELLETLMDDPDRDEKLEHEMGWDKPVERDQDQENFDPEDFLNLNPGPEDLEEAGRDLRESDRALKQIPAYRMAIKGAARVHKSIEPLMERREQGPADEDLDEAIGDAYIGLQIAAAKIAGGHGMGYDDDVLCANIVKNKLAVEGARQCRRGLDELARRNLIEARESAKLVKLVDDVIEAIEERIAELRSKVWW